MQPNEDFPRGLPPPAETPAHPQQPAAPLTPSATYLEHLLHQARGNCPDEVAEMLSVWRSTAGRAELARFINHQRHRDPTLHTQLAPHTTKPFSNCWQSSNVRQTVRAGTLELVCSTAVGGASLDVPPNEWLDLDDADLFESELAAEEFYQRQLGAARAPRPQGLVPLAIGPFVYWVYVPQLDSLARLLASLPPLVQSP